MLSAMWVAILRIYMCVYKAVLPHAAFSMGVWTYTEYVAVQ
jgi:hypothetical protein